jgi:5-methylcytosine-specific restriction endonuclease McrA
MKREPVEATPRKAMSPARRIRIWNARGGKCCKCGLDVDWSGPNVVLDHIVPIWLGGSEDDSNVQVLHRACDAPKTANDAKVRAKVKRLHKKASGFEKKGPRLRSRGFDKTRTRRFDGSVVKRAPP